MTPAQQAQADQILAAHRLGQQIGVAILWVAFFLLILFVAWVVFALRKKSHSSATQNGLA